jgi:hypothetical protein
MSCRHYAEPPLFQIFATADSSDTLAIASRFSAISAAEFSHAAFADSRFLDFQPDSPADIDVADAADTILFSGCFSPLIFTDCLIA